MNRRKFLQALFAVPCLGAPLLVPEAVYSIEDTGTEANTLAGYFSAEDRERIASRFRSMYEELYSAREERARGWEATWARVDTALLGEGG